MSGFPVLDVMVIRNRSAMILGSDHQSGMREGAPKAVDGISHSMTLKTLLDCDILACASQLKERPDPAFAC